MGVHFRVLLPLRHCVWSHHQSMPCSVHVRRLNVVRGVMMSVGKSYGKVYR
jgi:hypothetical protein